MWALRISMARLQDSVRYKLDYRRYQDPLYQQL